MVGDLSTTPSSHLITITEQLSVKLCSIYAYGEITFLDLPCLNMPMIKIVYHGWNLLSYQFAHEILEFDSLELK